MLRKLRLFLALSLGLLPLGLAITNASTSALDLFPSTSPACQSKNGTAEVPSVCQQGAQQASSGSNPVITALGITIDILSYIAGVSAVIVIVVGGIKMITASGDAQSFGKARTSIAHALIALVLVVLAQVIVAFVLNKL